MIVQPPFNHTELPQQALADRLEYLQELSTITHGKERAEQVAHEIACLIFEFNERAKDERA